MKLHGLITNFTRLSAASLLCATVAGCPSDEGISESEYISRTVDNICSLIFSCSCEDVDPDYTQVACVETRTQAYEVAAAEAEIDGLSFDGACGEEFVSELVDQACTSPVADQGDETCERPCKLYYGPMKAGESCEYGTSGLDNCKQGLICSSGLCEDPCDEVLPAEIGELCFAVQCVDGAWCDTSEPYAPVCQARPGFGQPCADTNPDPDVTNLLCADNLYCDEVTDPMNPVCAAFPDVGEECLDPGFDCAEGAYCDPTLTPAVCVDIPGRGEACTFVCEEGSFCDTDYCPPGANCDGDPSLIEPLCVESPSWVCNLAPTDPDPTEP
ncbi:MAG: hypothetical protein ACPHRO_02850 [Nannocystaceae bacterium]